MGQWVTEGSLGAILYHARIITEADIEQALAEQRRSGCRFGEALVCLGIVTAEDINWALSHHLDIPYILLNREMLAPDAASLLPERLARRFGAVPVIRTGDELRVALVDPLNREAVREIEAATSCAVTTAIADERVVRELLDTLYGPELTGDFGFLSPVATAGERASLVADPTGGAFVDWLLVLLARQGYRSVTLIPEAEGGVLTGRQGGATREVGQLTAAACGRFVARLRSMAELHPLPGGGERGVLVRGDGDRSLTVQLQLLKGTAGELVTLSRPECPAGAPVPPELVSRLRELAAVPGLVVVSLPAGEARRALELLVEGERAGGVRLLLGEGSDTLRERLLTVPPAPADPAGIAPLVAAAAGHLPDLLLIEEAGDVATLVAAARAALGGARVVAVTGAGITGSGALLRAAWRHHPVPSYLRGVVVGLPVPLLCPSCREELPLGAGEAADLGLPPSATGYAHAPGCAACGDTGCGEGRLLAEVIPCGRQLGDLLDRGGDFVPGALRDQAVRLLEAGEISPESYLRAVTA